jgi:four helix bundle protein
MASRGRAIRSYRDLEVWRQAMDLVVEAYRVSKAFPSEERYGLTAQLRRSAVSVPSNIAEGRGRFGLRGFLYHLSVANGSLMELETQLLISERLAYLNQGDATVILEKVAVVRRCWLGWFVRFGTETGECRYPIADSR